MKLAKNRIIQITAIIGFVLILILLPQKENKTKIDYLIGDINQYAYVPNGNGVSFGLINDDRQSTLDERVFNIKSNEKLKLNILVSNGTTTTKEFLIIPIIDYAPGTVNYNDNLYNEIEISLEPNKLTILPLGLGKLTKGLHDILFLIVKDPNTEDITEEYRKNTELNHVLAVRISVIVDSVNSHSVSFGETTVLKNDVLSGIFLSKGDVLKRWLVEDAKNDNKLDYTIQIGNTEKESNSYAVITMLNWKLVTLVDRRYPFFLEVKPNTRAVYRGTLSLKEKKKVNNFTAILIPKPYEIVDRKKNMEIEPSTRLAIIG